MAYLVLQYIPNKTVSKAHVIAGTLDHNGTADLYYRAALHLGIPRDSVRKVTEYESIDNALIVANALNN